MNDVITKGITKNEAREKEVILDSNLSNLYQVDTKRINKTKKVSI